MCLVNYLNRQALHDVAATQQLEQRLQQALPEHTLMARAGLAVARLALAIAPHAQRIWIAAGLGNNGGDGIEAALHLQRWGKRPLVSWLGHPEQASADTRLAYQNALDAGVPFVDGPPSHFELCIDALLGIGSQLREPVGLMADWMHRINTCAAPVLAVDVPSGLQADTGVASRCHVKANYTLSLLTLKPGLFTAQGRDLAGSVWLDDLQQDQVNPSASPPSPPSAWLAGRALTTNRAHASHKGSYGDVVVVGGASGMSGAALLAASAALHGGAGRVFVSLLNDQPLRLDTTQPELMFRELGTLPLETMSVVCGCGGGTAIAKHLPELLKSAKQLVIDADGLNAIAQSAPLQGLLAERGLQQRATILTPHPLEAARLLACSAADIQADRLTSAQQLARRFACTVVLKGSGTVIAQADALPVINPTGNARLATGGTGDVLAGLTGARLAGGLGAFDAACQAVYQHGAVADHWPQAQALTASQLARALTV
ncbi:MAG: bifunctional ADP-dependent (S)-NAD(P)H-hydrate dehydratase/NAD(P)H-hydrate epimerase [Comamonadaceae bacterium CG2_30_59_20]|nr:MAG: bifunctional ADP-dependent (S)-NAD(P)H-hydrate dehydratase/NAD(P)H-hydrate epimerase [Comamonadaceae bacterium CG2_30_59_20]